MSPLRTLPLLVCLHSMHFGHRKDSLWGTNIFSNGSILNLKDYQNTDPKDESSIKIEATFCYSLLKSVLFSVHIVLKSEVSYLAMQSANSQKALNKNLCLVPLLKATKTLTFTAPGKLKCIIKEQILKLPG